MTNIFLEIYRAFKGLSYMRFGDVLSRFNPLTQSEEFFRFFTWCWKPIHTYIIIIIVFVLVLTLSFYASSCCNICSSYDVILFCHWFSALCQNFSISVYLFVRITIGFYSNISREIIGAFLNSSVLIQDVLYVIFEQHIERNMLLRIHFWSYLLSS